MSAPTADHLRKQAMRHIVRAATALDYFNGKVRVGGPDECWPWLGSVGSHGYGNWSYSGLGGKRVRTAHRAAFALFKGYEAEKQVNHRCGDKRCCNPAHLYDGNAKQNSADAVLHGTHSPPPHPIGEKVNTAKLTEDQVRHIKHRLTAGESQAGLAREHSVNISTIHLIKTGRNWGWLKPEASPPEAGA